VCRTGGGDTLPDQEVSIGLKRSQMGLRRCRD
jgi:hypothetical protein